MKAVT